MNIKIEIDKLLHFFICFAIAIVLYPLISWWSTGTAIVTGIGKEIYDYKDYGHFSWSDVVADVLGVIAGIILILISIKLI